MYVCKYECIGKVRCVCMYVCGACLRSEDGREEVRLNAAQKDIGVGDREGPALAVADRPRMGSDGRQGAHYIPLT